MIDLTIPEGEDIRPLFDPKDPKAAAFLDEILRAKTAEEGTGTPGNFPEVH